MRWCLVALVVSLGACGGGGGGGAAGQGGSPPDASPPCAFSARLEGRAPDGTYRSLESPADVELVLGFQGFRYIYVRVRAEGTSPPARGSVVVELDGDTPLSQSFRLQYKAEAPGQLLSEPLMVFFNDSPLPMLVGRGCRLAMRVGDDRCGADVAARVTLRYDPGCYEGPSGERICTDGGIPPLDGGALPPDAGAAP